MGNYTTGKYFDEGDTTELRVGQRLYHPRFGKGKIEELYRGQNRYRLVKLVFEHPFLRIVLLQDSLPGIVTLEE